jgi:hypothetical protein
MAQSVTRQAERAMLPTEERDYFLLHGVNITSDAQTTSHPMGIVGFF